MSWLRIDDAFTDHPKVAPLSDAAFRLHLTGMCYAARFLTDGLIPAAQVPRLYPGDTDAAVSELQAAGLWQREPSGWRVHDFADFNPTRAEVLARRAARDKAARLGGQARAAKAEREGGRFTSGATSGTTSRSAGTAADTPDQPTTSPVPQPLPLPHPERTRDDDPLRTSGSAGDPAGARRRGNGRARVHRGLEQAGQTQEFKDQMARFGFEPVPDEEVRQ